MEKERTCIRRLGLDDYDALLALWTRAGLHSIRPQGRDSRTAIARQLASGVEMLLGLEAEGRLVGAVMVTHDSRKGWINRLAVDPDYRRRGYGKRLVKAGERELQEQGISIIAALVVSGNDASLSLLRHVGYAEIDPGMHYLTKRTSDAA